MIATIALNETLRAAADRRNIYLGSQFKGDVIKSDPQYKATHSAQFSLSTVGNECKWHATEQQRGSFTLGPCNAAFAYARSAKQAFRGHNLCWGNDNPAWLETGSFSTFELKSILEEHITSVMQGVKAAAGKSPLAWDVVNEATNSTAFFKPNRWYPAVPDYVDVAFRAARAADPDALLFYNDYGVAELGGAKAEQMYAMVASMRARGVPIDGVGLQAHLTLGGADDVDGYSDDIKGRSRAPASEQAVAANIARYGNLGLYVHITELDVKCPDPCDDAKLSQQADVYGRMLRACLANPGVCTSFETWGFTDQYTWLTGKRCPAAACHPLPFDEKYSPKPAAARMLWELHGGGSTVAEQSYLPDPLPFPDVRRHLPATMPALGHPTAALFTFENGWTNMNQGSYGAPPRAVQAAQREWSTMMEGNPEVFTRFAQYGAIDKVRAAVAAYVGADVDDVVLVDNASHGMNAVLRSLAERLGRDALVLDLNTVYGMVRNTLAYTEATFGQRVVTANLTSLGGVVSDDGVVEIVRRALEAAGGAIKLVSVSHITSTPALVLPVARLSALAHAHGALIVVDGAHVMGQIPLDVPSIGCDYYVSNGHKWLSSPKGSAFLWVAKAEQPRIFPTTISQEGQGSSRYVRDFSYEGTDDPTAWLSMAAALDFRRLVPGGDAAIFAFIADLAEKGGALLAKMWATRTLYSGGAMVNVQLPTANATLAAAVPTELIRRFKTFVPCGDYGAAVGLPGFWCRVSAYVYNDIKDFEMLGRAVADIVGAQPVSAA